MNTALTNAPMGVPIGVQWVGIGAYVPETTITNDQLTQLVDTSDEWIATRTGIRERHVVSGDETVAGLAIAAANDALASAGMTGEDIDFILVATSTPDTMYPGIACQVQHAIGATRAAGFDMALACSGFVFGLVTAQQFIRTGMYRTVLVIGADIHSRYVDWTDRNTCIIFGDGAGAAIVQAVPGDQNAFFANDLHSDGSKGFELTLHTNAPNCPLVAPRTEHRPFVNMNGKEMFKFAVSVVPETMTTTLVKAGLTWDAIDHVVLHQANIRIMQAMTERLGIPAAKMIANIDRIGNTSAASIPIALNEAVLSGRVKPGEKLMLCGFGAGVAWGSTLCEWTAVDKRLAQGQTAQQATPVGV